MMRVYIGVCIMVAMFIYPYTPTEQACIDMMHASSPQQRYDIFINYVRSRCDLHGFAPIDTQVQVMRGDTCQQFIHVDTPYEDLCRRIVYGEPVYYPETNIRCNSAIFESPSLVPSAIFYVYRALGRCHQEVNRKRKFRLYPADASRVTPDTVWRTVHHAARFGPPLLHTQEVAKYGTYTYPPDVDMDVYMVHRIDAPRLLDRFIACGLISHERGPQCLSYTTLRYMLRQRYEQEDTGEVLYSGFRVSS